MISPFATIPRDEYYPTFVKMTPVDVKHRLHVSEVPLHQIYHHTIVPLDAIYVQALVSIQVALLPMTNLLSV
jgi:hypothetical protein